MGPLPQVDRQAVLEELTFKAFEAALPPDRFCFRDERSKDAGVDASVELILQGCSTNFRSQVQLKGTDSQDSNGDGSLSLPVAVSNLNYLLNGPAPIYVLYVAPRNELWYLWAHEERRRLDAANTNWWEQQQVTIRFRQRFDAVALDDVYERIRKEGQFRRRVQNTLAWATTSERVVIGIDPQTLATTDPEQVYQFLSTSGMTLVAAGYGLQAIDLVRLLNASAAREPRIHLVSAYAQSTLGRYQTALGHVAEAELRSADLSADDRAFLAHLRDACNCQTGRITVDEFLARQEAGERGKSGPSALLHQLDSLRHALLVERDWDRRSALVPQLRTVVDQIVAISEGNIGLKLQARLALLFIEGVEVVATFSREVGLAQMRAGMGQPPNVDRVRATFHNDGKRTKEWEEEIEKAVREALDAKHPLLIGEALLLRATVHFILIMDRRITLIGMNRKAPEMPESALHPLMQDAEQAMKMFSQSGNLEGELRAKMALAEMFDVFGQAAAARSLAQDVLPNARAMGYVRIEAHANEHLAAESMFSQFEKYILSEAARDDDFRLGRASDADMRSFAQSCLEAAELPAERLPVVERECFSLRDVAAERLDWCRHLDLIQDKRHTLHPSTHYRTDPERWCVCSKHGYQSGIPSTDWRAVISAFRQTRCDGCPDRESKQ
jgi:hypothetical protein